MYVATVDMYSRNTTDRPQTGTDYLQNWQALKEDDTCQLDLDKWGAYELDNVQQANKMICLVEEW